MIKLIKDLEMHITQNNLSNKLCRNITNHLVELQLIMKIKSNKFFQNLLLMKSIKLLNQVKILSINRF